MAGTENIRNAYKILLEISEVKVSFWRPGHRRENNIKITLKYGIQVWDRFILIKRGFSAAFF